MQLHDVVEKREKGRAILKARNYSILLALCLAIVAVNSGVATAESCIAQLGYPVMPAVYPNSNVPIVVSVSATCTTYYGSQLYATGNAYDTTFNVGLGSASTVLQSVDGTNFNGQLGFNLPPSAQGHTAQISVSIYNGQNSQYGNLLTAVSETIQVGNGAQQFTTTTVTQQAPYPYPSPSPYPYQSPSPYPSAPYQYQSQPNPYRRLWQIQTQSSNRTSLFGYVAIAAILATAIIATTGLVMYGRRQTNSYPAPPHPSR